MKKLRRDEIQFMEVSGSGRYLEFDRAGVYASIFRESYTRWRWYVSDFGGARTSQGEKRTKDEAIDRARDVIMDGQK